MVESLVIPPEDEAFIERWSRISKKSKWKTISFIVILINIILLIALLWLTVPSDRVTDEDKKYEVRVVENMPQGKKFYSPLEASKLKPWNFQESR